MIDLSKVHLSTTPDSASNDSGSGSDIAADVGEHLKQLELRIKTNRQRSLALANIDEHVPGSTWDERLPDWTVPESKTAQLFEPQSRSGRNIRTPQ